MAKLSGKELRIMMIGENSTDKTSLGNFMTGTQNTEFSRTTQQCVHSHGEWQSNKLIIVKTPNFFELPMERVRLEMKMCVALCPPGPNVLLLLVKPFDFSEEDRTKLMLYLQFFGEDAVKHSLVVMMDAVTAGGPPVNQLIRDCGQRQYQSCFDERGLQELMEEMVSIVSQNQGRHLTFVEVADSKATDQTANGLERAEVCGKPRENMFTRQASVRKSKKSRYQVPKHHKTEQEVETAQVAKPHPYPHPILTKDSFRIVLLGKTGCGKSATANCILGGEHFISEPCMESVTTACQMKVGEVNGQPVTVVDTPGLFDTRLSNEVVQVELLILLRMLAPGPHVFLLVLPIGRFTEEDRATVDLIKSFFGERAGDFTVLLFTRCDDLNNQTLPEYLQKPNNVMKNLMSEFGQRYVGFNSTDLQNRGQVNELLRVVEAMVKRNGGGYYTSEMFPVGKEAMWKTLRNITEGTDAKETKAQLTQRGDIFKKKFESLIKLTARSKFPKVGQKQEQQQAEWDREDLREKSWQAKCNREVQQMRRQRDRQNKAIIDQLIKNKAYKKDYESLKKRQEEEISKLMSNPCFHNQDELEDMMSELQFEHMVEINVWIQMHVGLAAKNGACTIL